MNLPIAYPGPPTHGTWEVNDAATDPLGALWVCTVSGKATVGGTARFASSNAAGSDVASFNGRTGAVTLSKADVTGTGLAAADVGAAAAGSGVTSFNTRAGAVVPASGDYTAAQVTNAADTSSGSTQIFAGGLAAPALASTGQTGALAATYYVGGTTGGAPVSGSFVAGEWIVDTTGKIFVCTVGGTPGTWVAVDSTDLKLAGGTMSGPIAMGTSKITGLGNGSAAQDAAAFGQLPVVPGGGSPAPTLALGASQATNFTAAANTLYPCSATLTATLPVAPAVGTVIGVYRSAINTAITLAAGAGGTVNGVASVVIPSTSVLLDPIIVVQATSSTTWIVISHWGSDLGQGLIVGGALVITGAYSFASGMTGHVLAKTANYTTLRTDWWIQCTSNTFTITLGTSTFAAGTAQLVTNPGTGTVTIAAASGVLTGPTTLPPSSGAIFTYDGTNWNCDASWGTPSNTAARAAITTQAVTTGVAFTPSATADNEIVVPVTLAGTVTMTMGPSTGAENTILAAGTAVVAGTIITKTIPAGWKVVITLVTATLGTVTKQSL